jgi:hypothetical protein
MQEYVVAGLELLELAEVEPIVAVGATVVVVLAVLKVELRNSPKPTMRIITITMRAEIPREIAFFAFANLKHRCICYMTYLKLRNSETILIFRTPFLLHILVKNGFEEHLT